MHKMPDAVRDMAEERYQRYVEECRASGLQALSQAELPGDAERVIACSAFVWAEMVRRPQDIHQLVESGDLTRAYHTPGTCANGLPMASPESALVAHFENQLWRAPSIGGEDKYPGEEAVLKALRITRRREWLRLAWRDIGGLTTTAEMMAEASAFADAAVRFSLAQAHHDLSDRLGQPLDQNHGRQQLVVLALGKLGAGELNFSSDIDLIFAYPRAGETAGGRRSLSNNEFFIRLARQLVKLLTHPTPDGTVFRVDMRLRPFGDSGPLVMSFDAMEEYYQNHGRDWERYAMIRARALTGTAEHVAELHERLRPFIYRRYLDFGTLAMLREMKRRMTEEVNRRGLHNDVKLGRGGIREVEFTAQAFQMVRGGRITALRERCLLRVLPVLRDLELLPEFVVTELTDAYLFLRTLEHRLQQMDDRQIHELPNDSQMRTLLANGMGYADWDALESDLQRHRDLVHAQFAQIFGTDEGPEEVAKEPLSALVAPDISEPEGRALLAHAGYQDSAQAWKALTHFKQTHDVQLLDGTSANRLQALFPDLLRAIASQSDRVSVLERVLGVVQAIVRRSVYLSLLRERPLGLSQLVKLCAASPWIARQLSRHPILLDELLDTRHLYAPMFLDELQQDLTNRMANITEGDTEEEMECLRLFKHASVLRVAASDVAKTMALMKVSDHLTGIAEATLQQALELAWRDLCERHGVPLYEQHGIKRVAPFAIIGYGKLGGIELGYGSDLDIVFIHGSPPGIYTQGRRPIDSVVFFQRLGQRIIHFLSTPTAGGILYEMDSRLRPSGNKGPLAVRFEALASYLGEEAWTWEHQALVRARVVAGDPELGKRFTDLRARILKRPRTPDELRTEVREMRLKMRRAHGSQSSSVFDLKRDAGGIADIEFMVQYCALRWARELGDWIQYTDNIRLLEGLAQTGLLPQQDAQNLTEIFQVFRSAIHSLALQEQTDVVAGDRFSQERAKVSAIWNSLMLDQERRQ